MFPHSVYKALIDDVDRWCRESQLHTREGLADVAGVSPRVVYNWLELREDDQGNMQPLTPIPLAKITAICKHIKRYTSLEIFCAECGHLFIPIPVAVHNDAFNSLNHASNVLKEFGDFLGEIKIQEIDINRIEKEGREAMAAIQGFIEWSKRSQQGLSNE